MEVPLMQFPPGDPRVVDKIASQLKSQGIFDQFRKECISDVDTKPAYQNLHQRVEGTVASFLANQEWRPDLNKNQLRDSLRKHIHESGFLDIGVERIVDQVVNPKIMTVFLPQIEDVVYKCLGLEKPKKGKEAMTGLTNHPPANVPQKVITLKDLLPTDLDPISPESDGIKDGDEPFYGDKDVYQNNMEEEEEVGDEEEEEGCEEEEEEDEEGGEEEEDEEEEEKVADEEETSPPFEPIEEINSQCDESSMNSHLSGISELTSHDSQLSNTSFSGNIQLAHTKIPVIDLANHDSQLSKVSSCSRLSIVFSDEQEKFAQKPPSSPPEIDIANDESQLSKSSLQILSQESQASDNVEMSNQGSEESKLAECITVKDSSSDVSNQDTTSSSKSPNIILCGKAKSEVPCENDAVEMESSKTDSEEKNLEPEKFEKKHIFDRNEREKSQDQKEERKGRTYSESGDLKKSEHERKRSDKYHRDRSESKRSSRHDGQEKSDDKNKRDGGKSKENDKDTKRDRARTDSKAEKEKGRMEEREEIKDKPKHGEKIETTLHKNRSRNGVYCEKNESTDAGDRVSEDLPEDLDRNGGKLKSDYLFGEEEVKQEENLEKEGSKKDEKSRHKSKYDYKKERERNREKEKEKGRHDDRSGKDSYKEKSRHEDKLDRDSSKDKGDRAKNDKEREKLKLEDAKERTRRDSKSERELSKEKSKHDEKIEKEGNKDKQKSEDKSDKPRHDRSKHNEKVERDSSKDRSRHDTKQEKERRSDDRGKGSSDKSSKEKKDDTHKIDEVDGDKRERSRSESKKDKREKSKHDDRGRSKSESKHKDSTKTEGKEDGSSRSDKSSRDRSGNRDSKTKSKGEGKENESRREDKGYKERSKTDEKNSKERSSKTQSKGKENHEKKDCKRDDSDSGKSSRSSDHKGKKKEGKNKTVVDDHHIHHDKNSDDRRSTDRDSSGTQQSHPVSSRRNGSDNRSSHHHDKRESNSSSGNNRSDGGGSSESAADIPEDNSDQASLETPVSPSSSLPFKKRPVQDTTPDSDSREEYSCTMNAGKLILKSKKPKIAANIYEAKKIMHLRKSMTKIERKKQKEWRKEHDTKESAEHDSGSDPEHSITSDILPLDIGTIKEDSESDEEPLLYFTEEETYKDQDFLRYVKMLEESGTLSTSDESEEEEQVRSMQNFTDSVIGTRCFEEDTSCETRTGVGEIKSVPKENVSNVIDICESLSNTNKSDGGSLDTASEPVFIDSSTNIKSTHSRSKIIDNFENHVPSRRTSVKEGDAIEVCPTVLHNTDEVSNRIQSSKRRGVKRSTRSSESSLSEEETVSNQARNKSENVGAYYTEENDCGHSNSSVVEISREPSPAHDSDSDSDSADSSNEDDDDDDDDDDDVHKNIVKVIDADSDGGGYSYIRDNNNIDKSSSDDEKCGDGMALSNELILPALRDLMLESGFQLGDGLDPGEALATASGMPTPDSQGEMSEKRSSTGSGGSASNTLERKRPKLGRSRRVGLSKPHPSKQIAVGKRAATPPTVSADFVMPLSPESDVSASSVEHVRKGPVSNKADAPSLSEVAEATKFAHLDNDSEERRHLRSSSTATPARCGQVNSNEDVFKPRPLFNQNKHEQYSSTQVEEPVKNHLGKRRRSTIESDGPQTSKRRRR